MGAVGGRGALGRLAAADHDPLRAYYGTDARAAELLVGALLAVWVRRRSGAGRPASVAGPVALALLLWSWAVVSQSDGRLYAGGLLAHALLVAVVIRAATGRGPLVSLLERRGLRWLGRISYGAYLYHWPLFLWLTPQRVGLDGLPLAGVRLAASLALAEVSYRLLEEPIRSGRRLTPSLARASLAAGAAAVVVAAIVVTPPREQDVLQVALTAAGDSLVAPSTTLPRPSTTTTTVATDMAPPPRAWAEGERLRVYVAGDSNAFGMGVALAKWAAGRGIEIWTSGWFACHLVPGGSYRYAGEVKATEEKCNTWVERRTRELAEIQPHVTLVIYGSFDVLDRRFDGSDRWRHIGERGYDALLEREIERITDLARTAGSRVMWSTYPAIRTGTVEGVPPTRHFPENDPARVDRLNHLIRSVAASRPGTAILELRRHLQAWPGGELDPALRPDGVHPDWDELRNIATWAGPQLVELARR